MKHLIEIVQRGDFKNLPENTKPFAITVSYDMRWQKRACGKVYGSLSGHFFVGTAIGNVVAKGVLQKLCSVCPTYSKKDIHVPHHECRINHNCSSGSMEAILCMKLLTHLHKNDQSEGICRIANYR